MRKDLNDKSAATQRNLARDADSNIKNSSVGQNIGNYMWTICALIFFATSINYLDRAVIGF